LISLTSVEYKILKLLIQEHNSIITRQQFLDIIYDIGDDVFDRVIDVHIRNIRKKINQEYSKEIIKTIYGLGYSFVGVLDD
jgi:DNA-binding response OmpR family regulator